MNLNFELVNYLMMVGVYLILMAVFLNVLSVVAIFIAKSLRL